jgi:hypothetical protein
MQLRLHWSPSQVWPLQLLGAGDGQDCVEPLHEATLAFAPDGRPYAVASGGWFTQLLLAQVSPAAAGPQAPAPLQADWQLVMEQVPCGS